MPLATSISGLLSFCTCFIVLVVQPVVAAEESPTPALNEVEIGLSVRTARITPNKTRINLIGFPDAENVTIESAMTVLAGVPVISLNDKKQPIVGLNDAQQEKLDLFLKRGGALVSYKIASR